MKKIIAFILMTVLLGSIAYANATSSNETSTEVAINLEENYTKVNLEGEFVANEEGMLIFKGETEFAINTDENTLFVGLNGEKITINDLKEGDLVKIVADEKTTRSLPPQSYGYVVIVCDKASEIRPIFGEVKEIENGEGTIALETKDGSYVITVTNDTIITSLNGDKLDMSAIKEDAGFLFYTDILTLSLPAQGVASKIVILDQINAETAKIQNFTVNGKEIAGEVVYENDIALYPVRAIAEAMGFEVKWDDNLQLVTVGTIPMGVGFNIGVNSYNKAKMVPQTLSSAPILVNDARTYVPADFFTTIIGATATVNGNTIDFTINK